MNKPKPVAAAANKPKPTDKPKPILWRRLVDAGDGPTVGVMQVPGGLLYAVEGSGTCFVPGGRLDQLAVETMK